MVQHVVLWSYASIWKPAAEAFEGGTTDRSRIMVDPDPALPERIAFASLMRRVRSGAAPAWWATTDRLGHG